MYRICGALIFCRRIFGGGDKRNKAKLRRIKGKYDIKQRGSNLFISVVKNILKKQSITRGKQPVVDKNGSKNPIPKSEDSNKFCAIKRKVAHIFSSTETLRNVFAKREIDNSGSSRETRRRILIDFARQKRSLYGNETNTLVNCHGAENGGVFLSRLDRIELHRIIKLFEAIKTVNHLIVTELHFEAKMEHFSANDSHSLLNSILREISSFNTGTENTEDGAPRTSQSQVIEKHLRIDLLCSILHDLEHNAIALRAVIEWYVSI